MTNPFAIFHKDVVRVIFKKDGSISKDCKVSFSEKKLNLYDVDLDISEGDLIERDLPHGRKENYVISDVNYHSGQSPIPPFYILTLQKSNAKKPQIAAKTIVNLHGHNSRFYQNSNDNSINNIVINPDTVFDELRKVINNEIKNEELIELVNDMERLKGKATFVEKYSAFIQAAANHMTIISPFIPALTLLFPMAV